MLLAQLHDQLAPCFPAYARKDLQTAVRVLAKALQCADPQHCSLDQYNQPLPMLYRLVEDYLTTQGKGPHTIRNTKNYLSRLFRLAEQQNLYSLLPISLTPRYAHNTRPYRPGAALSRHNGTHLPYRHWPPDLQDAFTAFATWATAPVVPGRNAALRKRLQTIEAYRKQFEGYYGFLSHVQQISPLTFEQLFDLTLVTNFAHWHINELHHRPTEMIHRFLQTLLALTRQYHPLPDLRTQFAMLKKTLPSPSPVYNKEDAWVSLSTLNEIGCALWPRKHPQNLRQQPDHPGLNYAVRAGISLMLRLWTYIPYRQRNMREMKLGDNLHKDPHGTWRITFHGEQLKVAVKRGRTNTFDLPFPDTLVPFLEDYLSLWRPILLRKASQHSANVFLTRYGNPYQRSLLNETTKNIVYRYTGKHWHPHIVRTVWATEWLRNNGDFHTAAIMLNDRLETVIANYSHLLEEDVAAKAYRLIEARNGQGK